MIITYFPSEWITRASGSPKHQNASTSPQFKMSPPNQAQPSTQEGRILLAIQAFKLGQFKSIRAAAKAYDVPYTTLYHRIHRMTSRRDFTPNSQKLTPKEELAVIRYILDLDSRGFPPRPQAIQEMADLLLAKRDAPLVGKN